MCLPPATGASRPLLERDLGSCDNPSSCKRLWIYLLRYLDPCPRLSPASQITSGTQSQLSCPLLRRWWPFGPHNCPFPSWSRTAEKSQASWWSSDFCSPVSKLHWNARNILVSICMQGTSQLLLCPLDWLVFPSVPVWSLRYQSAGRLQRPPPSSRPRSLARGQKMALNRLVLVEIFTAWSKFLYELFTQAIFK